MVQRLHDRLIEEPNDTDGWIRLARAYNVLGQAENALDALTNGAKFTPENLDLKLALLEQILNMGTTKAEIERAKLVLAKGEKIAPKTHKFCFSKDTSRSYLAKLNERAQHGRNCRIFWIQKVTPQRPLRRKSKNCQNQRIKKATFEPA